MLNVESDLYLNRRFVIQVFFLLLSGSSASPAAAPLFEKVCDVSYAARILFSALSGEVQGKFLPDLQIPVEPSRYMDPELALFSPGDIEQVGRIGGNPNCRRSPALRVIAEITGNRTADLSHAGFLLEMLHSSHSLDMRRFGGGDGSAMRDPGLPVGMFQCLGAVYRHPPVLPGGLMVVPYPGLPSGRRSQL